jgi:hypothetical protein
MARNPDRHPANLPPRQSALDRVLALARQSDPATERLRLRALRRFVLAYGAVRSLLWFSFLDAPEATADPWVIGPAALWLGGCAVLAFRPRFERWAAVLALPVLLIEGVAIFPYSDNHFFLETICVALLALAGDETDDVRVVHALRIMGAIVLFHSGWQKLSYGLYDQAEFLTFMTASSERFGLVLGPFVGAESLATLRALDPLSTGAGPFRSDSLWLLLGSNAVVAAELALPVLLLVRRTRALAIPAALALVLLIQIPARELGFALLFTNVLMLFAVADWNQRLAPLNYAVLALALLAWPWLVPGIL